MIVDGDGSDASLISITVINVKVVDVIMMEMLKMY